MTAAALALLLMTLGVFGEVGLVPVAAGLFVLVSALGLVTPNTTTLALMRTRNAAAPPPRSSAPPPSWSAPSPPRWSASRASTPPSPWRSSS
ncbi:hypothetical protein ACFQVA_09980 [Actinomadura keratinilytica]